MFTLFEGNQCLDKFIQTNLIQDAANYIVIDQQKNVLNAYDIIKNN